MDIDTEVTGVLAEIGDLDQGTLASLVVRKKGVERGPQGAKVVYGDDYVHVVLWTGFHYKALVERSLKKLGQLQAAGDFGKKLLQATIDAGCSAATINDVYPAMQQVEDSLRKVLAEPADKDDDDNDERTSVWEPLEVNGQRIRGSKVYVGKGDPNRPRAPIPGTVYLDGVKLGEKVIAPAKHGSWTPQSKSVTIVKNILKSWLPCGLYVRYCLEREGLASLKVGKEAGEHAKEEGVMVDPEALRQLFKIAP